MSSEPLKDVGQRPTRTASGWRRWSDWLQALEETFSISADDIQDRRIAKLEADVVALQSVIEGQSKFTEIAYEISRGCSDF